MFFELIVTILFGSLILAGYIADMTFQQKAIIELLIAEGADVNAPRGDAYSDTPLDRLFNSEKAINLLRKYGGNTGEELKAEGK